MKFYAQPLITAMGRSLIALREMPERHRFIRGMVSWIGYKQEPIEYDRDARFAGETKYPLKKMIKFAIDAMTSFSIKPLRFATLLGVLLACVATPMLIVYTLVSYFALGTQPGWTSLLSAISLLGGVQLLVLGVLGEYIGRIFEQVKARPLFVIREVKRS